jgi:ATP-binding cassette, subfamily B, bacterial PglK
MIQMASLRNRIRAKLDKNKKFNFWILVRSFLGLHHKLKKSSKRYFFLLLFFVLISSLSESLTLASLYYFLSVAGSGADEIYLALRERNLDFLVGDIFFVGAVFAATLLINAITKLLILKFSNYISYGISGELASLFVNDYLERSYLEQKLNKIEFLQGTITRKASVVAISFQQVISFMASFFTGIFVIGSIFYINGGQLIPLAIFVFLIYFFVGYTVKNKVKSNGIKLNLLQDELIKFVQILKYGIRNILLENTKNDAMQSFDKINTPLRNAQSQNSFFQSSPRIFIEFIGLLILIALIFFNNDMKDESLLAFMGLMAFSFIKLIGIAQIQYSGWTYLMANGSAIIEFNQSFSVGKSSFDLNKSNLINDAGYSFKELVFKNVSFSYPLNVTPVLDNISFTLQGGKKLGIVGRTGQGKSTLLDIILGLVNPSTGEVAVNGSQLLNDMQRHNYWNMIAHIPQDIFLFGDSVYENIVGVNHFDQNRFNEILHHLDLDKFCEPLMAKSYIGAGGLLLSGGERQRVAIAKILYKGDVELLVLDEATSALDSITELKVWEKLISISRTVIAITHNPDLVKGFDIVLQVENGKLNNVKSSDYSV